MKNFVDALIQSINAHNPNILPMADRYYATENGIPAALMLMETYRVLDRVSSVGTIVEDEEKNTAYVILAVAEGSVDVILGARMTGADDKISEIEINIYRSRSDTGFWYAVQDIPSLEEKWDSIVPAEKRATRKELENLGTAIFDNSIDGNLYPSAETCQLMEAGGLVMENVGYAKALTPPELLPEIPEGTVRIPMGHGLGPIRPNGADARILAIDESKGLVVVNGLMDGYVSPYIVSDENSSCFVPMPMIKMHHSTLAPDAFDNVSAIKEMYATADNTTIAKFYDGKIQYLTQNIKIKTLGGRGAWRDDVFVKEGR